MKTKTNKHTRRLRYITSIWQTLLKLENKKNEHDRTQNRHEHYWKTEQYFYDITQNRIQLNFGEPNKEVIILKTPHKKG